MPAKTLQAKTFDNRGLSFQSGESGVGSTALRLIVHLLLAAQFGIDALGVCGLMRQAFGFW